MAKYNIPGVYSDIDASAAVQAISANDSVIGIIADADTGVADKAYAPTSYENAVATYGDGSNVVKLMATALQNGGSKFIIVKKGTDIQTALDTLLLEEAVNIVIVDSTNSTDFTKLLQHVKDASADRKERIAFVGLATGTDINTAITQAGTLNSGRVYLAYPNPLDSNGNELSGIYGAAAMAGQVAAESDPSRPMTGVEIAGFYGLSKKLKRSEIDSLIVGGVMPLEVRNGSIRLVRAVSTYTKDPVSSAADITWQELTTTRISDYIFKDLRNGLAIKFARAKQNKQARDSVKSEVLNRLVTYQSLEYIENVENKDVSIQINPTNPTQSDVIFKYDVCAPMNVIHLTGHLVI